MQRILVVGGNGQLGHCLQKLAPKYHDIFDFNFTGSQALDITDKSQIEKEFKHLKTIFDKFTIHNSQFTILSMGMSGDYQLAISCGSTMVRIGSSIFGRR